MKLHTGYLSVATALVAAAAFTICSALVAVVPGALSAFVSYALHIDITGIARPITFASFIIGVVFIAVSSGVFVAAVAGAYNGFASRRAIRVALAR